MTIYGNAEKYTCSSCAYYKFEGENERCRCSHPKTGGNYYPWDHCTYWEEAADFDRYKRPLNR